MKLADFHRLKKFMALCESDIDAEALQALKMANVLIRRQGLTWERVLDRSVKVMMPVEDMGAPEQDPRPDRKKIDEIFDEILAAGPRGKSADFVESLQTWWTEKGFLTAGQMTALEGVLESARNGWRHS